MYVRLATLVLILTLFLAACGGNATPPATPTLDPGSDAGRGQVLFRIYCATCHATTGETVVVGPPLLGVADRAATRVSGLDAENYLHDSILYPNDYVVEGFAAGTMQQNFASVLTSEEVNQLVAYLLTLHSSAE